jgi:hypothetical protein
VVTRVVRRAQESGDLRPDFDTTDVPIVQLMLTAVMEYTREVDGEVWRRCLGLVSTGCAPRPPTATRSRQRP